MKRMLRITISVWLLLSVKLFASEANTLSAISALKDHIGGFASLTGAQIAAHKSTIDANQTLFETSASVIQDALDLVNTHEIYRGALWVNGNPVQEFDRLAMLTETTPGTPDGDMNIDWVIYNVMQYIVDHSYTNANVASDLGGITTHKFGSSADFPGSASPPVVVTHTASINASYLDTAGWEHQGDDLPARKPTGTYLAPGTVVTVDVPAAIVNKGYQIRVGAHAWDLSTSAAGGPTNPAKRWVHRLDRSTILYDIDNTSIQISSPLGGGIYIEVPFNANEGVVDIDITGAVRSPFFSAKSFHTTTLSDWQTVERNHPAPWADFQSEKFMMQVPTDWIYAMDDPVTMMAEWDQAMDIYNRHMGFPEDRGKESLYLQVDLTARGVAFYPGYPQSNVSYDPNADYGGFADNHFTNGPLTAPSYVFHEKGHGYFFKKFHGDGEANVNLGHVAIFNQMGKSLDYSFASSLGEEANPAKTLSNTAITWMLCFNFANGDHMDTDEKNYQLKGHAKFVEIARLFGWGALESYYGGMVTDGVRNNTTTETGDDLIVRISKAIGYDARPLLKFWGVPIDDPTTVANEIAAEGLGPSNEIHDMLIYYRSIIPKNNQEFQEFANAWWQGKPNLTGFRTENEHAQQWDTYDATSHATRVAVIDSWLAEYFPGGDPSPDLTAPTPSPMTWKMTPRPGNLTSDTISIDDSFSGSFPNSGGTYTMDLSVLAPAFDAGDSDMLIVITGNRGSGFGSWSKYIENVSYNGVAMEEAIGVRSFTADAKEEVAGIYYLTEPSVTGTLEIKYSDSMDAGGGGYTVIALSGASTLTDVNSALASTTSVDTQGESITFAVGADDQTQGLIQAPFTSFANYANYAAGYYMSSSAETLNPSFASSSAVAAAVFDDGATVMRMTATTAIDTESNVEYYFSETSGNPGGDDSGWQSSPHYVDTGLTPGLTYTYTVKARDVSANQNETLESAPFDAEAGADLFPPVLLSVDDDDSDGRMWLNETLTYTIAFDKDVSLSTIGSNDFDFLGTASASISAVNATADPKIVNVVVSPTTVGTLQLQIRSDATIEDLVGNNIELETPFVDDLTIVVIPGVAPYVLETGGYNSWGNAANWQTGLPPIGNVNALIAAGVNGRARSGAMFNWSGSLTMESGSSLEVGDALDGGTSVAERSLHGAILIDMDDATIYGERDVTLNFADIILTGNGTVTNTGTFAHSQDRIFQGAISGSGTFEIIGTESQRYIFQKQNTFTGGLTLNANHRYEVHFDHKDAAGAGDVTVAPRSGDGQSAVLVVNGIDVIDDAATVTLNGSGWDNTANGSVYDNSSYRMILNMHETIGALMLDNVAQANGSYGALGNSAADYQVNWISGDSLLVVGSSASFTGINFANDATGSVISVGDQVVYTVAFDSAINASTLGVDDFGNNGTASVTIDSITPTTDANTFIVAVTANGYGSLQLQVKQGTAIDYLAGPPLDTVAAITDANVITVNPSGLVNTISAGGADSWNQAANWSLGTVPDQALSVVIAPGVAANANNASTPAWNGLLVMRDGSSLEIPDTHSESSNALNGATSISMYESTLVLERDETITLPAIDLVGDGTIDQLGHQSHHDLRIFNGAITGSGSMNYVGQNNQTVRFMTANSFTGGLVLDARDRYVVEFMAAGSAGSGPVTVNSRSGDGRSAVIFVYADGAFENVTTLTLNGSGWDNSGGGSQSGTDFRMFLDHDESVDALILDNVSLADGRYSRIGLGRGYNEVAWIHADGVLSVGNVPLDPYEAWVSNYAGLTDDSASLDFDSGGLSTGMEWVLGGDPVDETDDASLLPQWSAVLDTFEFIYRRSDAANEDVNTTITVEYSNDLQNWTTATHGGLITISELDDHYGAGVDRVSVVFAAGAVVGEKLFVRLKVEVGP